MGKKFKGENMSGQIIIPEVEGKLTGGVRGVANCNWWQYARDVRNISRNSRVTLPKGAQLAAIKAFIDTICKWDDVTDKYIGTRTWLGYKLNLKAISKLTYYVGDTAVEPAPVLVKVLEHISRDLKKIPVNDAEKTAVDTLIAATDNRRLGTEPYFGGVIGEKKTI